MFWVISGTKSCLDPTYHTWLQSASIDGHFDTHKGGVCQHFIFDFPYCGLKLMEASALVWLGLGSWGWWRWSSVGARPYIFHAHFKWWWLVRVASSNFHMYISTLGQVSMIIVLVYLLCHTPKLCLTFFEIIFKDSKVSILIFRYLVPWFFLKLLQS